jgi:hypothetical protein
VQFFLPSVDGVDIDEFLDEATEATTDALFPKQFRLWARNKWNGPEESVSEQLLLELCHGLLARTWLRVMARLAQKTASSDSVPPNGPHVAEDPAAGGGIDALALAIPIEALVSDMQRARREDSGAPSGKDHASVAAAWLASRNPTAASQMILWRLFVHIPATLMKQLLYCGSKPWERKQQAKAVKAQKDGGVTDALTRDYPILVAARGELENQALSKCVTLMRDAGMWMLIPTVDLTNRTRATGFLMGTVVIALIHKNFTVPHGKQPFTSFLWLLDPAMGQHLENEPKCMLCPWSSRRAANGGFTAEDARHSLLLLAHILAVQNALCENNNAWIHRRLNSRVQTNPMTIEDLNVKWLAHVTRRRVDSSGFQPASARETESHKADSDPGPCAKRRKRCSGGAWRAFVRECASTDLRRVGELYRNLDQDERDRLRSDGQAATAASRDGSVIGTSFGAKRRDAALWNARRVSKSMISHLVDADVKDAAEGVIALSRDSGLSVSDMTIRASQLESALAAQRLDTARAEADSIMAFRRDNANNVRNSFCTTVPRLAGTSEHFHALPSQLGVDIAELDQCAAVRDAVTLQTYFKSLRKRDLELSKGIEAFWKALSCEVTGDDAQPIADSLRRTIDEGDDDADETWRPSKCWQAGICVCSPRGKKLLSLRNAFLSVTKLAFPAGSDYRKAFVSGHMFCRVSFRSSSPTGVDDLEMWGVGDALFHFCLVSLSPYDCLLHRVCVITDEGLRAEANPAGDETAVQVIVFCQSTC